MEKANLKLKQSRIWSSEQVEKMKNDLLKLKLDTNPFHAILHTELNDQMKLSEEQIKSLREIEKEFKEKVELLQKRTASRITETLNSRRREVISSLNQNHQSILRPILLGEAKPDEK